MSESRKVVLTHLTCWVNEAGKYHRLDGPAIEYNNGVKEWWVAGKLHRLDGPAVDSKDRTKYWYQRGKLHRLDGPAVEYCDGRKKWYLNGKYFPNKEAWFNSLKKEDQIAYLFKME